MTVRLLEAAAIHEAEVLHRRGVGPAAGTARLMTRLETSSRLSAEIHNSTCASACASTIRLLVNWRHLSCVRSIAEIVSENTMHAAVSSLNAGRARIDKS